MHKTILIFLTSTIVSGTILVITSEKWFIIWVGLELSTLALVPILCSKFSPRKIESTIKYFLIQALSAAILLKRALVKAWLTGSWSILDPLKEISVLLIVTALAFKIGLAPCHFWLPDVLQGLPFSRGLVIASWQKISPLVILFSFEQISKSNLIPAMGVLSVLIGGWGGLNQTQIRKILAFSSIGKMGWIRVTSFYSQRTALTILIIYLIINRTVFLVAKFMRFSTLGHLNIIAQLSPATVLIITLTILSLGGLPPLTGFMIKFMSLHFLLAKGFIFLSIVLILGTLLRLFFYVRISFKTSLVIFPQHIISLSSWRKTSYLPEVRLKTWVISAMSVLSTISIPLSLLSFIFI